MIKTKNIQCDNCGATIKFSAKTNALRCEYCGKTHPIQAITDKEKNIQTLAIQSTTIENFESKKPLEITTVQCETCSAETSLGNDFLSKNCPFCDTPLIIKKAKIQRLHQPHYLLPFKVSEKQAVGSFHTWINQLWFAPTGLVKQALHDKKPQGIYLPFWCYDCTTHSNYHGKRGQQYSIPFKNRLVTKTRWKRVKGQSQHAFNNVLVSATHSLPQAFLNALEPWDLDQLTDYQSHYLNGFKTENYQITLRQAFLVAKDQMSDQVNQDIKLQIGGDKQIINQINTEFSEEKFKYILLPCWVSAYRFKHKTYQFVVNGRTAKVQSQRPYSLIKITLTMASVAGLIYLLFSTNWQNIIEPLRLFYNSL